jgi:hypothetical protein
LGVSFATLPVWRATAKAPSSSVRSAASDSSHGGRTSSVDSVPENAHQPGASRRSRRPNASTAGRSSVAMAAGMQLGSALGTAIAKAVRRRSLRRVTCGFTHRMNRVPTQRDRSPSTDLSCNTILVDDWSAMRLCITSTVTRPITGSRTCSYAMGATARAMPIAARTAARTTLRPSLWTEGRMR